MAFVFTPAPPGGFGRRLARGRRGVDWRAVALTALAAVLLIAMLGRPA